MVKFEECDMILIYHFFSVLIINVTKWIKSNQLICLDPELLHDMWIKCINISTIKSKMSQDTVIKLITVVINIFYLAIRLFCPFVIIKLFFFNNQSVDINCCFIMTVSYYDFSHQPNTSIRQNQFTILYKTIRFTIHFNSEVINIVCPVTISLINNDIFHLVSVYI